jgi:hypothetical protein
MAIKVRVVEGTWKDGDTETSVSTQLSKKIYDLLATATVIHTVQLIKLGNDGVRIKALLVYETA